MEQVRSNGAQKELTDEIVDLGTRYGIVTPYTSYLALESDAISRITPGVGAATRRAGTANLSTLDPRNSAPSPGALSQTVTVTGEGAIAMSKSAREQQDIIRLSDITRKDAVRRVETKTFYLIDGVWTDSEFKAESRLPETALVFGSDEYFALLKQHPKLGNYFALGQRVLVVFEGRVYRVSSK
jgi:Ca-activated chloride channel family protein